MKQISIVFTVLLLTLVGCTKEQGQGLLTIDPNNDVVSFTATFEGATDPDTKLGIDTGERSLSWVDGDAIAVQMTDDTFIPFVFSSSTNEFSASLGTKKVKDGGVAYYPASIAINGPSSVTLPASFTLTDGVASVVHPPMMATVSLGKNQLNLTHLGGILSIAVSYVPADADKLVLTVLENTITGTFAVVENQISAGSESSTVTINFDEGDFGISATEFFIPVPVTTFTKGFSFAFKNKANQTLFEHNTERKNISVTRKSINRMAEVTVPFSIYVRNNATNWDNFQAYYYTTNGSYNSTWGTDELSGSASYTHNGVSYKRFIVPTSENNKNGNIIMHNYKSSDESPVERIQIKNIAITHDYYYSANGDGAWRVYVCDGLNWSGGNLRAWKDGWECFTGVKDGVGPAENGTSILWLEYYNNYTFKYWTGIDSDDMFYYQFYKSDNTELTNSWGISRPGSEKDIVFNAYFKDGEGCKLEPIGTGYVSSLSVD